MGFWAQLGMTLMLVLMSGPIWAGAEQSVSLGFTPISYHWRNGQVEVRFIAKGQVFTLAQEPSVYLPMLNHSDEAPFSVFRISDGGALIALMDGGTVKIPEIRNIESSLLAESKAFEDGRYELVFFDPESGRVLYMLTIGVPMARGRSLAGMRMNDSTKAHLSVDDFLNKGEASVWDMAGFSPDFRFSVLDPLHLAAGFMYRNTVTSMLKLSPSLTLGQDYSVEELIADLVEENALEQVLRLHARGPQPGTVIHVNFQTRQWTKNPDACETSLE